jgi:thiamine-monophosphate kinase
LAPQAGRQLAISTDMLVEGRHFLSTVPPRALGHKALAVNLSDLAACGAKPLAFTLALCMPRVDAAWLEGFSAGLMALAREHDCELIGGDTTAGPVVTISITVFGEVPDAATSNGQIQTSALLRSGAQAGDDIWVSGHLGDARLALAVFRGELELSGQDFSTARHALEWPSPRVALGLMLRGLASAAIDVSDGLTGDLKHILQRSKVGAKLNVDAVPRSAILAAQSVTQQRLCTLAGGDDYELVFTAAHQRAAEVQAIGNTLGLALTRIGHIDAQPGLRLIDAQGHHVNFNVSSFDHFRA